MLFSLDGYLLEDVKEVVMPTPVKAMLASYLVDKVGYREIYYVAHLSSYLSCNITLLLTQWEGSEAQRVALSQGVGLVPIDSMDSQSAAFWTELAGETSSLSSRDKVSAHHFYVYWVINSINLFLCVLL